MTGTWVNVAAIVAGALLGVLLRKGIPQQVNDAVLKIEGLAIVIIGFNGVITSMLSVDPDTGRLDADGGLLLLVSLTIGYLAGELLRIDDRLGAFGAQVERRIGAEGLAQGFITASLVFSIGAMGVMGALNDGLTNNSTILYMKSILDFTIAIALASALGIGVAFSALPVLLVQGSLSLLSVAISPFVTAHLLDLFCMVGYAIVLVIGFNFLCNTAIKTANLLPAMLVPIIYYFVRF